MLLNFLINLFRVKTHGGDVESVAVLQPCRCRFHQRDGRVQCVGHIHHIHIRAGLHRTYEFFSLHGRVENIHRIVRSAATRRGHVRNDSRKTYRACIHTIFCIVIVTQQFSRHFSHAIHGTRTLDSVLWCLHVRRSFAERTDGTRGKHGTIVLARHFKYIPQPVDTDFPSHGRTAFGNYREQGSQVVDCINLELTRHHLDGLTVCHIGNSRRTGCFQFSLGHSTRNVSCHNMVIAITFAQLQCEFRSNLSGSSNYQNILHTSYL